MDLKVFAFTSIVLLFCSMRADSFAVSSGEETEDLRRAFEDLELWFRSNVNNSEEPQDYMKAVKNFMNISNKNSFLNSGHRKAMKLLVDLSNVEKCNDDTLKLIRKVSYGTKMLRFYTFPTDKVLKHLAPEAIKGCKEYIVDKFNKLSTSWKKEGIDVAVDKSRLAFYADWHHDDDLRWVITQASKGDIKEIKFEYTTNENGERIYDPANILFIFNKYFANPCKAHNRIMGEFLESVIAVQSMKYDSYADFFSVKEYSEDLQTDLDRYRFCNIILKQTVDDLSRIFNVELA